MSKDTYVQVARDEHGIQGRPTNNSRVSMLTGLSRREVARVRDRLTQGAHADVEVHGNRLSRILSGWHTDSDFADDEGHPLDLPAEGPDSSFEALLRRYGGDLPHGAIRKEMVQRKLIEELHDGRIRVLERDYVISTLDPSLIRQFGLALHDHATTLSHNLNEDRISERRFEGMADNLNMSPKAVEKFQELISSRGLSFLEEADTWLSENELTDDTDARTVRLGVGVYFICDKG